MEDHSLGGEKTGIFWPKKGRATRWSCAAARRAPPPFPIEVEAGRYRRWSLCPVCSGSMLAEWLHRSPFGGDLARTEPRPSHRGGNRFTPNDQETYDVEYSEIYPQRIDIDFRCAGSDRRIARKRFKGHCADIRVTGSNEGNRNLYCPSSIAS